jgi:hypothetical protein
MFDIAFSRAFDEGATMMDQQHRPEPKSDTAPPHKQKPRAPVRRPSEAHADQDEPKHCDGDQYCDKPHDKHHEKR